MAKFLLFLLVLGVIYLLLRASRHRTKPPPVPPDAQAMTRCAHCGVHFPRNESVSCDGLDYCCAEHRQLGAGT